MSKLWQERLDLFPSGPRILFKCWNQSLWRSKEYPSTSKEWFSQANSFKISLPWKITKLKTMTPSIWFWGWEVDLVSQADRNRVVMMKMMIQLVSQKKRKKSNGVVIWKRKSRGRKEHSFLLKAPRNILKGLIMKSKITNQKEKA